MKPSVAIKLLSFCEWMKVPQGTWLSRTPKIRYCHYLTWLWSSKLMRKIVEKVPSSSLSLNQLPRTEKVIVSLTSYPARINEVALSIKTLFLQTYKPDSIILWLASSQFPRREKDLPDAVLELIGRGLEINFCEDYKSHKKYFYSLQRQRPDELVMTFDDDIFYRPNTIQLAVNLHNKYPDAVIVNDSPRVSFSADGSPKPYSQWDRRYNSLAEPSYLNAILSGSGCLYPYGALPKEAFDWDAIKECGAVGTDDLWVYVCAVANGRKIAMTVPEAKTFSLVTPSQSESLGAANHATNQNDIAFSKLLTHFPNALSNIQLAL